MTTIISPKYSFNNDMKYHQEDNDGEQQNDNDEEVHLSDNGCDNYNIKEQNEELVTYNKSQIGELESDLDETRSDFKLVVRYLMEVDKKFSRHHDGILISHKSISAFFNKLHQEEDTMGIEIASEKSEE